MRTKATDLVGIERVMLEMIEDFIDAVERLHGLLGD